MKRERDILVHVIILSHARTHTHTHTHYSMEQTSIVQDQLEKLTGN